MSAKERDGAGYRLIDAIFDGARTTRDLADDLRSFARSMARVGSSEGASELLEIAEGIEVVLERIKEAHGDLMAEESGRTAKHFASVCELGLGLLADKAGAQ